MRMTVCLHEPTTAAAAADSLVQDCCRRKKHTLSTALHFGQRSSRMPWPRSLPEPLTFGGALWDSKRRAAKQALVKQQC
jgi:hypothetical protein